MDQSTFERFRDEVKQALRIEDLLVTWGVELRVAGRQLRGCSPFNDERHPSFFVDPAKQLWHDFSGGGSGGGDVFALLMQRDRLTFGEALREGARLAGVEFPVLDTEEGRAQVQRAADVRALHDLLTKAAAYYHRRLPAEIRDRYFHGQYGFSDDTIDSFKLGWADGSLRTHFIVELGLNRLQCLATGLFVELGEEMVDFYQQRLVFPYWKDGRVAYFTARKTHLTSAASYEESKYKKLLTTSERHKHVSPLLTNSTFYNEDSVRGAELVVITEGQPDCISASQAGFASIAPGTTQFRRDDVPRLVELTRRATKVVLCNDNEANGAGEAGARATAAALWEAGRPVFVSTLPRPEGRDKIDVNDLVREQGPEAFRKVVDEAAWWPDYLIACVPRDLRGPSLEPAIAPVLAAASHANELQRPQIIDALSKHTGIGKRALNKFLKETTDALDHDDDDDASTPFGIQTNDRQARELVMETRDVLANANEEHIQATLAGELPEPMPLFVKSGRLVALDHSGIELRELSEAKVHGALIRVSDWYELKHGKNGRRLVMPSTPPVHVVRDMLAYPPPQLPQIDTVLATPTFASDGTLISVPGVHESASVWMTPKCLELAPIPEHPSPADVDAAKALLLEDLLVDFPFTSVSDRTHFLAAMLLPFARRLIDGNTPLHLIEAPTQGTGKGLLVEIIFQITTGAPADVRTLPTNDEEARKAITSELLRGKPLIVLDNADERGVIQSLQLTSVLTAESWTDRLLGTNDVAGIRNRATWLMTANNPRLSKDVMRRSIRIRIDAKRTDPWRRSDFRHNPLLEWVKAERPRLVAALVTIIQAWIAAGRPLSKKDLGSFSQWAHTMGGIFEHAQIPGFLENLDDLYARSDSEGSDLASFVAAWAHEFGQRPVTAKELTTLCERNDLLVSQRGDGGDRSQQSRMGRLLHRMTDTCVDEWQIGLAEPNPHDKKTRYGLKHLASAAAATSVDPWID